jgi:TRAP-type C4-dicarboxylate transport system permease small subunit
LWIPLAAMPLGIGLLVLQYLADIVALVTGRAPPFGIRDAEGRPMSAEAVQ